MSNLKLIFEGDTECHSHTLRQQITQLRTDIMTAFDDLKREIAETREAVSAVADSVAAVAERVAAIVGKLSNSPDAAEVAALAVELDAEQTRLTEAKASLDGIAPAPPPPPAA